MTPYGVARDENVDVKKTYDIHYVVQCALTLLHGNTRQRNQQTILLTQTPYYVARIDFKDAMNQFTSKIIVRGPKFHSITRYGNFAITSCRDRVHESPSYEELHNTLGLIYVLP